MKFILLERGKGRELALMERIWKETDTAISIIKESSELTDCVIAFDYFCECFHDDHDIFIMALDYIRPFLDNIPDKIRNVRYERFDINNHRTIKVAVDFLKDCNDNSKLITYVDLKQY